MRCQYCGSEVALPFKCPFCGRYFCADHRLPELHVCEGFREGILVNTGGFSPRTGRTESLRWRRPIFRFRIPSMGGVEVIHFALGTLMVMLVGLTITVGISFHMNPLLALLPSVLFALAFLLHELGHKFVAEHYGLWAEFRLTFMGVIVTLISIISPIKIVAPGTVIISGEVNKDTIGKVAFSGPLINMLLSIILLSIGPVTNYLPVKRALLWGFTINALLSFFNLVPFSILDGNKVLHWNKYIWALSFAISMVLLAAALNIYLTG